MLKRTDSGQETVVAERIVPLDRWRTFITLLVVLYHSVINYTYYGIGGDRMRWIGFDRILFASDYPHWDFDDPVLALPPSLTDEQRRAIYAGNAKTLYGLA